MAKSEAAELRELRRRNKLLEQKNEIVRRATAYFARDDLPDDLPSGPCTRRRAHLCRGDLPGAGQLLSRPTTSGWLTQ